MYQRRNNNSDRDYGDYRRDRYDDFDDDYDYGDVDLNKMSKRARTQNGNVTHTSARQSRNIDSGRRGGAPSGRNSTGGKNKKGKKKISAARIVINIVAVLVIIMSALSIVYYSLRDQKLFSGIEEADHVYPDVKTSDTKDVEYYLVCGLDESKQLTDVIMMVCWDKSKNTANIMQIPRDTFTSYDYPTGKINAVYGNPREGESSELALCRVVNKYFGLPVDHYIYIPLSAFRSIVDTLGGVEVDVPMQMSYGGVTVYPGTQVLDGAHAEVFMRNRKTYAAGDMGRVAAQRKFYAGLAEKLVDMNVVQMVNVFNAVKNDIITDMTVGEIKNAISDVKKVDMKKINIFAVPGEGYDDYSSGSWNALYTVHKEDLVNKMNKYMNPYGDTIEADNILIKELANTGVEGVEDGDTLGQFKESTAETTAPTSTEESGNGDTEIYNYQ